MAGKKKEKPKHLGRGLQSLIGPTNMPKDEPAQPVPITYADSKMPPDVQLHNALRDVNIESIIPNPYQPRKDFVESDLKDLAESIRANGVIQPIVVRPSGKQFELIAGERRFRASKMIGLKTIPAVLRTATDEEMLELALVENIHRSDLNPIERANAYRQYLNTFNLTQVQAAEKLGENRSNIANYLRLLDLPKDIKQMLINGELSMGHARAILALPTDDLRRKLANRSLAGRLSVREVERLVRNYTTDKKDNTKTPMVKPAHIVDLENSLTSQLGTKVLIDTKRNGKKGKITIEFYSLNDFDRILEQLGISQTENA